MRIRTAAIAGASAIAVALSGATAVAQDSSVPETFGSSTFDGSESKETGVYKEGVEGQSESTLSSKVGAALDADQAANGPSIFGSSKGQDNEQLVPEGDEGISSQPKWAQALYGVGVASAIVTVIGLAVGPVLNFIKYGPQTQFFG